MKKCVLISVLCFLPMFGYPQKLAYNFSLKKEGYLGNIKSIRSYSLEVEQIDSIRLDSIIALDTLAQSFKIFNEKGLLIKSEYSGDSRLIETFYEYNDNEDLISIKKIRHGSNIVKQDNFIYNSSDNTIIQFFSHPQKDDTGQRVIKKIYKFDSEDRNTRIDYVDSSDVVVRTTRLYYDGRGNLTKGENYKFMNLVDSFIQTYDLDKRKTGIKAYRRNGELFTQTVFNQIDEETKQMKFFDSENNLLEWHKSISKKDKFGNTVKEYIYDLIGKTTIVNSYEIDYYP